MQLSCALPLLGNYAVLGCQGPPVAKSMLVSVAWSPKLSPALPSVSTAALLLQSPCLGLGTPSHQFSSLLAP